MNWYWYYKSKNNIEIKYWNNCQSKLADIADSTVQTHFQILYLSFSAALLKPMIHEWYSKSTVAHLQCEAIHSKFWWIDTDKAVWNTSVYDVIFNLSRNGNGL